MIKTTLHIFNRDLYIVKNLHAYPSVAGMILAMREGETYPYTQEPCIYLKKEPCIYPKEPCIYLKEPYIYFKEPHGCRHDTSAAQRRDISIHSRAVYVLKCTQRSRVYTQKSPTYTQNKLRHLRTQKSPTNTQKSPI